LLPHGEGVVVADQPRRADDGHGSR
jgi:hypothetical protein